MLALDCDAQVVRWPLARPLGNEVDSLVIRSTPAIDAEALPLVDLGRDLLELLVRQGGQDHPNRTGFRSTATRTDLEVPEQLENLFLRQAHRRRRGTIGVDDVGEQPPLLGKLL